MSFIRVVWRRARDEPAVAVEDETSSVCVALNRRLVPSQYRESGRDKSSSESKIRLFQPAGG
jgi:hypothetical protein